MKKIIHLTLILFFISSATLLQAANKKSKKSVKNHHISGLEFLARLGYGYDSNPFYTPSASSYIDYSTSAQPTIYPVLKSGSYIPYALKAAYGHKLFKKFYYELKGRVKGRSFIDANLKNADNYDYGLHLAATYYIQKYKSKKSGIQCDVFANSHYEIYVDHDNGELKNTRYDGSGSNIETRYQYTSQGINLLYFLTKRRFAIDITAHIETLDYATPPKWSELDHTYSYVSAQAMKKLTKKSKASLEYRFSIRDYISRPAFDYNSTKITLTSNLPTLVPLKYLYHELKTAYDKRFNKHFSSGLRYNYIYRIDTYKGYNTSNYHKLKLLLKYKKSKNFQSELFSEVSMRRYPTAIAYDKIPSLDPKRYDKSTLGALLHYRLSKQLNTKAELFYEDQRSSDKRYEYQRFVTEVDISYRF